MPLTTPMVIETARKMRDIMLLMISIKGIIDTMTKKWLLQTPNPPRNRTYIISRPHPTADRSSAEILPQRYHTVYQLY